ncbi:MAG: hypothetical protein K6T66_12840 [Peptococcaceae bacterium]|nr:hypothetical protein [Peptococcaceae bacterium]
MNKKRFYLTPVIAKDIYGRPVADKNGDFVISHWTYEHRRFYPGKDTGSGFEYLEDNDGARYNPAGDSEFKVYTMKKGNVVYELVIP